MRNDQLRATVQYQDLQGTVAADYHDQKYLQDLAKKHGIDVSLRWVIGVRINLGETLDEELGNTYVELLLAPGGSIDSVKQIAEENGELRYETYSIECTLGEILLYFKRFEVALYSSVLENTTKFRDTTYE